MNSDERIDGPPVVAFSYTYAVMKIGKLGI